MNSLTRRDFIQNILKSAILLPLATPIGCSLFHDEEEEVLIVNELIRYSVISRSGSSMSDGSVVPDLPDGMACFLAVSGNYLLLRNHELESGPERAANFPESAYDIHSPGGVTLIELDKNLNVVREQHALTGTSRNCSGGPTPWNTWLTCEESTTTEVKKHGYVFEVDPNRTLKENAVPLTQMGRFRREACGVHAATSVVYMTEDQGDGCFYRYRPVTPERLIDGGTLEALRAETTEFKIGEKYPCRWIELTEPDPDSDTLRVTASALGATIFNRGEGIAVNGDEIYFTCTTGGAYGLGQIFIYNHQSETIELLIEGEPGGLLRFPDNLTFNQQGDLLICEDSVGGSQILGLTPDKKIYEIAYTNQSEWAGVCVSPDNRYVFANSQETGETFAFEIPWEKVRNQAVSI